MKNKKQSKKVPISKILTRCGVCGEVAKVLYWNKEIKKWECEQCHFKKPQ